MDCVILSSIDCFVLIVVGGIRSSVRVSVMDADRIRKEGDSWVAIYVYRLSYTSIAY